MLTAQRADSLLRAISGETSLERRLSLALQLSGRDNNHSAQDKLLVAYAAARLAQQQPDYKPLAQAYLNKGLALAELQQPDSAMAALHQMASLAYQHRDSCLAGRAEVHMAEVMTQKRDYATAARHLEKVLPYYMLCTQASPTDKNYALRNLAGSYYYLGSYEKALNVYQQALRHHKQYMPDDKQGLSGLVNNLGLVYEQKGLPGEALQHYQEAKELLAANMGRPRDIAIFVRNCGRASLKLGLLDQAQGYLDQAANQFRALDDSVGLAFCYNLVAELQRNRRQLPQARQTAEEALRIFKKHQDNMGQAAACLELGRILAALHLPAQAEAYMAEALALARKGTLRLLMMQTSRELSNLAASTRNYKLALEYMQQYDVLRDSLFADRASVETGAWEARFGQDTTARNSVTLVPAAAANRTGGTAAMVLLALVLAGLLAMLAWLVRQNRKMAQQLRARQPETAASSRPPASSRTHS